MFISFYATVVPICSLKQKLFLGWLVLGCFFILIQKSKNWFFSEVTVFTVLIQLKACILPTQMQDEFNEIADVVILVSINLANTEQFFCSNFLLYRKKKKINFSSIFFLLVSFQKKAVFTFCRHLCEFRFSSFAVQLHS